MLVLNSVRILLTEAFVKLEYGLPGFPADRYGFSQADRIRHATVALRYLLNDSGIDFLGQERFADGRPVYNERELSHMEDVKRVTQSALRVRWAAIGIVVGLGILLLRVAGVGAVLEALASGSRLSVGLMLLLGLALGIGFAVVFVGFHRVFFESGTWMFRFEDTLIRLFPERFWQVAFGAVALASLLQAGVIWALSRAGLARMP